MIRAKNKLGQEGLPTGRFGGVQMRIAFQPVYLSRSARLKIRPMPRMKQDLNPHALLNDRNDHYAQIQVRDKDFDDHTGWFDSWESCSSSLNRRPR